MSVIDLNFNADPDLNDGRPVLVLLHGFTQSALTWDGVRDGLRRIGPTVALDLIGHGDSPKPEEISPYRMQSCLEQLDRVLDRLGLEKAWLIGYSMGGRVGLSYAAHRSERVQGMVLISTSAGLTDPEVRQERRKADEALAARIPGWGIDAFLDYWFEMDLFAGFKRMPPSRQRVLRAERRKNSPIGLANSLRGMGTGAMLPVWAYLRDMEIPALVMSGELDEKFTHLARGLASSLPMADLSVVPDTGHALHLESPQRFISTVVDYFKRVRKYG